MAVKLYKSVYILQWHNICIYYSVKNSQLFTVHTFKFMDILSTFGGPWNKIEIFVKMSIPGSVTSNPVYIGKTCLNLKIIYMATPVVPSPQRISSIQLKSQIFIIRNIFVCATFMSCDDICTIYCLII